MVLSTDKQMDWSSNYREYCFVNTWTSSLKNKIKHTVETPTSPLKIPTPPKKKLPRFHTSINYVLPLMEF